MLDAGHGTPAGDGDVRVVHGPGLRGPVAHQAAANGRDQVRHPEPGVTLLFCGHSEELRRAALAPGPDVQRDLYVGVLDGGELLGDYRQLARIRAEVLREPRHERRLLGSLLAHRLLQEGPKGASEGGSGERRFVGHATPSRYVWHALPAINSTPGFVSLQRVVADVGLLQVAGEEGNAGLNV